MHVAGECVRACACVRSLTEGHCAGHLLQVVPVTEQNFVSYYCVLLLDCVLCTNVLSYHCIMYMMLQVVPVKEQNFVEVELFREKV